MLIVIKLLLKLYLTLLLCHFVLSTSFYGFILHFFKSSHSPNWVMSGKSSWSKLFRCLFAHWLFYLNNSLKLFFFFFHFNQSFYWVTDSRLCSMPTHNKSGHMARVKKNKTDMVQHYKTGTASRLQIWALKCAACVGVSRCRYDR